MAKKLTDIGVRNLKPGAARREIPDGGCTGLYLILQPNGKRSWAVRYRHHDRTRKLTLGSLPPIGLAEARKLATEALHDLGRDIDPGTVKQVNKRTAAEVAADRAHDTIERLAELYLEQHARKKTREKTWKQAEAIFHREVLPRWRGRTIADIGRKDVRELVRAIAATRPILANRCQAYLSRFFRWLVNEDYITGSPVVGIERPAKETVRDRALSDDEIRRFWAATNRLPAPVRSIYRMLLLSGARLQEIAGMQWRELNLTQKIWTLPAQRSKSKAAHILPLSPLAWQIIEAQPRIAGSDYVFGARRPGFSYFKRMLDAEMKINEHWVNHDLRRTARSLMARARVESEVAERMIGHLPRGIVRTYNVHDFVDEKRDGFAKLEREIDLILNPPAAAVLPFRR
jgi:integrase